MTSSAKIPMRRDTGVWVCPRCGSFSEDQTDDGLCTQTAYKHTHPTSLVWTPVPAEIMERYEEMCQLEHLANLCGLEPGDTLEHFRAVLDRLEDG